MSDKKILNGNECKPWYFILTFNWALEVSIAAITYSLAGHIGPLFVTQNYSQPCRLVLIIDI